MYCVCSYNLCLLVLCFVQLYRILYSAVNRGDRSPDKQLLCRIRFL